jgi:hypothetical protein
MAYNTVSRSVQEIVPAPPWIGTSPAPQNPALPTAPRRSVAVGVAPRGSVAAPDQSVAATSALLRFLILLIIISGLTCLYVWQANTISAIKADTRSMVNDIRDLDRQNVNLMLAYSRLDSPGYIETESRRSGMLVGHAIERVAVPAWSQPVQDVKGRADPMRQSAALLPTSVTVGSRSK